MFRVTCVGGAKLNQPLTWVRDLKGGRDVKVQVGIFQGVWKNKNNFGIEIEQGVVFEINLHWGRKEGAHGGS